MCLVRGRIFGVCANYKATMLSLNARQWTSGEVEIVGNPFAFISHSSCIMEIAYRSDCNKLMYSSSFVDSAICVCSLLHQMIRQLTYRMT